MRKILSAVLAVTTIAGAIAASANDANAQRRHHRGNGGAVAAGVIGGLAVGAILGGAIANSQPAYGHRYVPVQGYDPYPVYRARYPDECPGGYWARRPVAFNAYGEPVAWSRPRFFCP